MPKVTLYVKDSDEPIWEKAKQVAGEGGLSSFVTDAIADYLPRRERSLGEVVIEGRTPDSTIAQQFRFIGTKVASKPAYLKLGAFAVSGGPPDRPRKPIGAIDVYVTKGHSIVVHANVPKPKSLVESYRTFREFEKAQAKRFTREQLEAIASAAQHSKFVEIE